MKSNAPPLARGKPLERPGAGSLKPEAFRKTLLKMRDGPRGREPANGLARLVLANGVPLTLIDHFVFLCVSSVPSVVKKRKYHSQAGEHREREAVHYTLNKNRNDRWYCTTKGRLQEEIFSSQSQFSVTRVWAEDVVYGSVHR